MKKSITTLFLCALLLLTNSSCSIGVKETDVKIEPELSVEQEKNESETSGFNITYIEGGNSLQCDSLESLYRVAELVVVATPEETYLESEQVWMDIYNNEVQNFEDAMITHSYTMRKCKVNKVYKGEDKKMKEFYLYERAISNEKNMTMLEGEYIAMKGNKYLLFLYEAKYVDGLYMPLRYQGKYDTEADNSKNAHIDQSILKEVKELYKEDFKS